jgi:prepilin-type N-terminal cleavage/methylation domain-containing protein
MKVIKKTLGAFTLIELLVVVAIIGILASATMPALSKAIEIANISKNSSNIRQILLACRTFAGDWEGMYPYFDPDADEEGGGEGSTFSTSTEAFNVLIPDYLSAEGIFWIQTKHPDKLRQPEEDGELKGSENVYGYAVGQTNTGFSNSPLVFDGLMDGPGEYGEYHPWLAAKKAVIGYSGGHVIVERLTSGTAGATVQTKDRRIKNIFEERTVDENGKASGGWLETTQDKVLLPD